MYQACYICGCVCISVKKLINHKSPKNNKCAADNLISNLNALQNVTPHVPTNYNDIKDNISNNSDDDPKDLTGCIGYVKTMDYIDVTEIDESINYDEHGIFYWN